MSENHDTVIAEVNESDAKCPVMHDRAPYPSEGGSNHDWWPNRLNVKMLAVNSPVVNPLGEEFNYAEAFSALDFPTLKRDIEEVLTTPQAWWPPDFGHYGPLIVRMAWHAAGTYRIEDGRGG